MKIDARAASTIWRIAGAVPDLLIAGGFLITWVNPHVLGTERIRFYLMLMMLEFIVVHSAAFMGTAAARLPTIGGKVVSVIGLACFYSLFAGGFALSFKSWWPLVAFWLLTINRLVTYIAIGIASDDQVKAMSASWGASVLFYVLGAFMTVLIPLPRFGVTSRVVASLHLTGSGLWIDEPHRVMAFGFLYFTAQAVYGAFGRAARKAGSSVPDNI